MNESLANTVILITGEGIGSADIALQHKLLNTYLSSCLRMASF
jgi:hypothetical protein